MEKIFQSVFKPEKVPSGFRERLLQKLLSEVDNTKGVNNHPIFRKVDFVFLVSSLASIGIITYGIILSEQTWVSLIQ
jgi:hypothetical protein